MIYSLHLLTCNFTNEHVQDVCHYKAQSEEADTNNRSEDFIFHMLQTGVRLNFKGFLRSRTVHFSPFQVFLL